MADNIARVFADAIATDPTRPLLTWYDDASGDRTELSGATLANWVSKTANLLVDEVGLGPGDPAGALLPPHWQTAAVLLGCWSAKLNVLDKPGDVDVLFAAADRADEAQSWPTGDRYALGLLPLAAPLRQTPAGFVDYVVEVRRHGDHFTPQPGPGPADERLLAHAQTRAAELGITRGARILVNATAYPDPVDWLLAPLTQAASVVLCANLDPTRLPTRLTTEQVTHPLP
ncbi:TIGR03089 family protein [Micromonospora vulcania]|uniref:TIGR03089 family protein n=1 Tax=Micromonospora vulcania TaxID=1441873 RepID=A0ABW1HH26_9ACTN